MGVTKTQNYSAQQNELAQVAKALAHPARVAILQYLLASRNCICGTLVDELGLAQATVSQHLKVLKEVGLIQGTIEGTSVCYCIEPNTWERYRQQFEALFTQDPNTSCNC